MFQSDKKQHIKHYKIPGLNGLKLKNNTLNPDFLYIYHKLKPSQTYFLKYYYETTYYFFYILK